MYYKLYKIASIRFIIIFFFLFIIFENNGAFPFWDLLDPWIEKLFEFLIPWTGTHVFHLDYEVNKMINGSGDTSYDYIKVFIIFVVSAVATIIWICISGFSELNKKLYYWFSVAIRYYVGLMVANYGLWKLFKLQFPYPTYSRLAETFGESSPMGLAWTFLGFSNGYNIFMGIAELVALLLLFRRTMTAGAIITLMTTLNVMAVNYFFDVPVKIISTALVMMTGFLLLNDFNILWRFFIKGESVQLATIEAPIIQNKKWRLAKKIVKFLIIGSSLAYGSYDALATKKEMDDKTQVFNKLSGIYHVDKAEWANDSLPMNSEFRWMQLIIENYGKARVKLSNDSLNRFDLKMDTLTHIINFKRIIPTPLNINFNVERPDEATLILRSQQDSIPLKYIMNRQIVTDKLMTRGFHWINEVPFNK